MLPALLHAFSKPTSENFKTLVRSEGVRVWDENGKEYIDGLGGLWYCQVGHSRPELIDAITEQLKKLSSYHTFAPMGSDVSDAAAERIRSVSPSQMEGFFFCSGSESVDSAIKLLRKVPILKNNWAQIILRRGRGYHGVNIGGTTMQGIPANREGWGDFYLNVIEIDPTNIGMQPQSRTWRPNSWGCNRTSARSGGVFPPEPVIWKVCYGYVMTTKLFVFDEAITGFGRTGTGLLPIPMRSTRPHNFRKRSYKRLSASRWSDNQQKADVLESDPDFTFMHGYTYMDIRQHPLKL